MTIPRRLMLTTVVLALALASQPALAVRQQSRANRNTDVIRAEVRGTLHFQAGQGYFISIRSKESFGGENRVWLWVSEDKVLVRRMEGLNEKEVIAKGELEQMPENVRASVPPLGMFLRNVEINGTEAK